MTSTSRSAHLDGVHLLHVCGAHEDGVAGMLELELNPNLCVAHHQLGGVVLGLDVEQALQAYWPTTHLNIQPGDSCLAFVAGVDH